MFSKFAEILVYRRHILQQEAKERIGKFEKVEIDEEKRKEQLDRQKKELADVMENLERILFSMDGAAAHLDFFFNHGMATIEADRWLALLIDVLKYGGMIKFNE